MGGILWDKLKVLMLIVASISLGVHLDVSSHKLKAITIFSTMKSMLATMEHSIQSGIQYLEQMLPTTSLIRKLKETENKKLI